MARFSIELYHVSIWPRSQALAPAAKGAGGEKFSDFYLAGGHENSVQRGLTTEDLTGVGSYALMLVAVCVFSYFGL